LGVGQPNSEIQQGKPPPLAAGSSSAGRVGTDRLSSPLTSRKWTGFNASVQTDRLKKGATAEEAEPMDESNRQEHKQSAIIDGSYSSRVSMTKGKESRVEGMALPIVGWTAAKLGLCLSCSDG
jgi:hypothetical protein